MKELRAFLCRGVVKEVEKFQCSNNSEKESLIVCFYIMAPSELKFYGG